MRCKGCQYSLEKLTGPPHRCPECGREFDPNFPAPIETRESERYKKNIFALSAIACLGAPFLIGMPLRSLFGVDAYAVLFAASMIGMAVLMHVYWKSSRA